MYIFSYGQPKEVRENSQESLMKAYLKDLHDEMLTEMSPHDIKNLMKSLLTNADKLLNPDSSTVTKDGTMGKYTNYNKTKDK